MIKTFFTNAAAAERIIILALILVMEVILFKPQKEKEKWLMAFIGNT